MGKQYDFSLSASKLNLLRECVRCFYFYTVLKIDRPRGAFPSLPGGIDRVMKDYADKFPGAMPPFLQGKLPGVFLRDRALMGKLRQWQSGLKPVIVTASGKTVSLIGGQDEILQECPGFATADFKTKGDRPKDSGEQYYQTQVDTYGLMMKESGWQISGRGYLIYFWPEDFSLFDGQPTFCFGSEVYDLESKPERAREKIEQAVEIMSLPEPPAADPTCEVCTYQARRASKS